MTKITMKQGTSRNVVLTFLESDGKTPLDLTGGKVYFTVNSNTAPADDSSAAMQKIITSFSTPTTGKQTVNIVPADTSALTPGTYHHDAKAITSGGTEVSSDTDAFILKPAITRSIT